MPRRPNPDFEGRFIFGGNFPAACRGELDAAAFEGEDVAVNLQHGARFDDEPVDADEKVQLVLEMDAGPGLVSRGNVPAFPRGDPLFRKPNDL
jgi:hypothetical protein